MMGGMESLRGQLLIAGSGLVEPNFRRTVVLVGEHNEEGALGVVLNRPTALPVEEAVPPLSELTLRLRLKAAKTRYLATPVAEYVGVVEK